MRCVVNRTESEMAGAALDRRKSRRRPAASPWTRARVAELKRRWWQGASAGRIAREWGPTVSRAAVLGKIRRLGLAEPSPTAAGQGFAWKSNRGAAAPALGYRPAPPRLWRARTLPAWVIAAKPYVDDPGIDADIPRAQRRPLLGLNDRACRWPVGDPSRSGFFFCGAESLPEKPFCAAHCARAYRAEQRKGK